jgi:hypothetical protein
MTFSTGPDGAGISQVARKIPPPTRTTTISRRTTRANFDMAGEELGVVIEKQ